MDGSFPLKRVDLFCTLSPLYSDDHVEENLKQNDCLSYSQLVSIRMNNGLAAVVHKWVVRAHLIGMEENELPRCSCVI